MTTTIISADELIRTVERCLQDSHPGGVTLSVVPEGVHLIGDWWHVPVRPSAEPPHTFEFYDALAVLEGKLNDDEGFRVLLEPYLPDEAAG